MRVKARAVILIDGRLIVAEQRRCGRTEHSLPGGRVNERESVLDALKREVAEETGLEVTPGQLVYVSEIVESVRRHDLELIFLAESFGVPGLNAFKAIDIQGGERLAMNPPILEVGSLLPLHATALGKVLLAPIRASSPTSARAGSGATRTRPSPISTA